MSKLNPFLQEVETNEDLETGTQESLGTIEAPKVEIDKTCPEGSIWDDDQGMCVLEEEIVLDEEIETKVEEEIVAPVEEEDLDVEILTLQQLTKQVLSNSFSGEFPEFNEESYFHEKLPEIQREFKKKYPRAELSEVDIQMYFTMHNSVLEKTWDTKNEKNKIAESYFSNITDIISSEEYNNNNMKAGQGDFDFNEWMRYGGCEFDSRKQCSVKYGKYIKWKKDGTFDVSNVSEELINQVKLEYFDSEKQEVFEQATDSQKYLFQLLGGEQLSEVTIVDERSQPIYDKKRKILEERGYLNVARVMTLGQHTLGIRTSKVVGMIKAMNPLISFSGDFQIHKLTSKLGDKAFKILRGKDGQILIQTGEDEGGVRKQLTLYLDDIGVDDKFTGESKTQENWDKLVSELLLFFSYDYDTIEDNIEYIGGTYNGESMKSAKKRIEKETEIRNIALLSNIPTTIDIVKDSLGGKQYTYERGTTSYSDYFGVAQFDAEVYYRVDAAGNKTVIEDKELLTDLYIKHYNQKYKDLKLTTTRFDPLYSPLELDTSTKSYSESNSIFTYGVNSSGELDSKSSKSVAFALNNLYKDWNIVAGGAGEIIVKSHNPNSPKKIELNYLGKSSGGATIMTVQGIEQFKLDLIGFINSNSTKGDIPEYELQAEKRQEIYNKFFGDNGIAITYNEEQLEELKKLELSLVGGKSGAENDFKYVTGVVWSSIQRQEKEGLTEEHLYAETGDPYADDINQAISILNSNKMPVTHSAIEALVIEMVVSRKENDFVEENIERFWDDMPDKEMMEIFGINNKNQIKKIVELRSYEVKNAAKKNMEASATKLALIETAFQSGEDAIAFNSFMDILSSEETNFIDDEDVTQEALKNGDIFEVRTPDGRTKYVPKDTYMAFSNASLVLQMQLNYMHSIREDMAKQFEKIQDIDLYHHLVGKSYEWSEYLGTNLIGGIVGGYVKVQAAISSDAASKMWLDVYSDIKRRKGRVSDKAAAFGTEQLGWGVVNPMNWPGFFIEFGAEQAESFSQFGFGMMLGTAMGSPHAGLLIGAGFTGMSTYSGNYMDEKFSYFAKHGNLDNFDQDNKILYESLAIGGVNFVSAYVSGKFLSQTYNFLKSVMPSGAQKIVFYETLQNYINLQVKYGSMDSGVEALTEISENIIKGEPINWDLAGDVFIDTGLFNLLLPTIGVGMSGVLQFTCDFDANSPMNKNMKKIVELQHKMQKLLLNKNVKVATIENVQKEIDEVFEENKVIVRDAFDKMGEMSKAAWEALAKIEQQQKQIQNKIVDIKKDNTLSWKEKQEQISQLEDQYKQNKGFVTNFMKSDNIKNNWSVLDKSEKKVDVTLKDDILEKAKKKLEEDGNADPTELELSDAAGVIYNGILITENFNKAPKRTALSKRSKLAQTKDDAYELINDFYDTEINRLKQLDQDATIPGQKMTVSEYIQDVKKEQKKAINGIKNGNHGISISSGGGGRLNITVVENAAKDGKTENKTHEVGHDVWIELLGGKVETYQPIADIVESYLQKSHPELYAMAKATVEPDANGNMVADELIMYFLELAADPNIKMFEGKTGGVFASLFTYFSAEAVEAQTGVQFNFDIKGPKGAIHFLKTLAEKLKNNDITKQDIVNIKESALIQDIVGGIEKSVTDIDFSQKMSQAKAGLVNELYEGTFPEIYGPKITVDGKTTREIINTPPAWVYNIIEEYGGMIRIAADKYARIPGIDYNVLDGFKMDIMYTHPRGLMGLINEYNPESADYTFVDKNGNEQTISITYNKDGEVKIEGEKAPDLSNYTREQMMDYVTRNYGNVIDRNQVPLSGYINKYIGVRVIDVAKDDVSISDAIAGITVQQGDTDVMGEIPDDSNGADDLFDQNNENIEEKTGEVRKILNVEKDGILYNKVIDLVKATLPDITTNEALSDPKNQKKYRQELQKIFTLELKGDLKEIFDSKEKFVKFLTDHQDAITRLIAIKYKNKFKELTFDAGRMDTETMQEQQVEGTVSGDTGAGNTIWEIIDLSPKDFVKVFTEDRKGNTRKNSLLDSLAAELGLDAVFTALPPSLESKTGKLSEALKRDPNTKFSVAGNDYDFKNFEIKNSKGFGTGEIDVKKLGKDIRELAKLFRTQGDFFKYLDLETMTIVGHPEFDPSVVAFVFYKAHNPELDASTQYYKKDLVGKDPILSELKVVQDWLATKAFDNNADAQKIHIVEVVEVATNFVNGGIWLALKGRGFGLMKKGLNASRTIQNKGGPRNDERTMTGNDSHRGKIPILVKGWKFDYKATITIGDITYTGAFVGTVDGKKVTSLDPVGDPNIKAKVISAPHYNSKLKIQNNLNMDYNGYTDKNGVFHANIPMNLDDIAIMNKDVVGGIFDRLEKLMYGSVEEYGEYGSDERKAKQNAALELMMPEINRANTANTAAHANINLGWFDAMLDGKATLTGLLQFLQLQTNDTMGPRGLSTVISVSFPLEPKTNKIQGEHLVVTAETSGKVAKLAGQAFMIDEVGRVIGWKEGWNRERIKAELLKIARDNAQIVIPHAYSVTMDAGPGKNTSSAGLNRNNFLTEEQQSTLVSTTKPNQSLTESKIDIAIEEELQVESEVIESENVEERRVTTNVADIYTKNSKSEVSKTMIADFDETMWTGGDNVIIATNPKTGETVPIASEDFHKVVRQYEKDGWTFNFDDFVNVVGGERGPYWDRAVRFIKEEGLNNFSILTARQPEAAIAIAHTLQAELIEDGVINLDTKASYTVEEILEQITGLGVGGITVTGKMKADWIFENIVSNGHTKVEFADDGLGNVEEVKIMFADLPIGTVEGTSLLVTEEFKDNHAKFSKKTNSETFNIFVEETSGVPKDHIYSRIRAEQQGKKTGRINNLVPYSAEDFKGLLYQFLGKGKMGEYQLAWFTEKLIKPYSRGESNVTKQAVKIGGQLESLMKSMPEAGKKLKDKIQRPNGTDTYFTKDMAVRVYLWTEVMGIKNKSFGLSDRDTKLLVDTVKADNDLIKLAGRLSIISNTDSGYVNPSKNWVVGNILDDIQRVRVTEARETHMLEFQKNADEIFSEENLNKIEAIHGTKYRQALENMLARMKTGRSDAGFDKNKDPVVQRWDEWINNSVGAIMFLNGRSAVLQTLSTFNYVKMTGPNNMINAAKAFSNQPQFWADFLELWNGEYLLSRRDGEKRGVNENELAKAVKQGGARGAIAYLLKLGFTPTKLADSFAIASGGATYVRNYTNAIEGMLLDFQASDVDIETLFESQDIFDKNELNVYLNGRDISSLTEAEIQDVAKKIALEKWELETESGQQSSRQDMLSQEQTGGLGRLILAFKNTPMQYTRKITRALQDLKNNRGNPAEHLANIAYYGGLQSLMFNGLQQALFARLDDDEEDWDEATDKVVQGMVDSYIQGMGLTGAVIVTVKNGVLEFVAQDKKGWNADHTYTILEFANISPTIGSKLRKLYGSIKGKQLNEDVIGEMDLWDPQNPAWMAVANIIEAFTNIPSNRIVNKMNNLLSISANENEWWQNLSLLLGWNTWDVDVETKSKKLKKVIKEEKIIEKKKEKIEEAQEVVDIAVEEEKKENKDVNQCGAPKSDGSRCSKPVDKPGQKCDSHASKEELKGRPKCEFIKPNKMQCKLYAVTGTEEGGKPRCNTKQHQPGYKKN